MKKTYLISTRPDNEGDAPKMIPAVVLYEKGRAFVHNKALVGGQFSDEEFIVSHIDNGYAFGEEFWTLKGAKKFARHVASVPELMNLSSPEDARKMDASIVKRMRLVAREIHSVEEDE